MKNALHSVLAVLAISSASSAAPVASLTGVFVGGANTTPGTPNGQGWNNRPFDGIFDIFITDSAGAWLNSGASRQINVPLGVGVHTFNLHGDSGNFGQLSWNFAVIGLNFDLAGNASAPPQITAAVPYTFTPGINPPFSAYAGTTYAQDGSVVTAANTLMWTSASSGATITLTDYWFAQMGVIPSDRVGPTDILPNGQADYVGQFTLAVIPSPASAVILSMIASGSCRRRRARVISSHEQGAKQSGQEQSQSDTNERFTSTRCTFG